MIITSFSQRRLFALVVYLVVMWWLGLWILTPASLYALTTL